MNNVSRFKYAIENMLDREGLRKGLRPFFFYLYICQ